MSEHRNVSTDRRLLVWEGRGYILEPGGTFTVDDVKDVSFEQPGIWERVGSVSAAEPEGEPAAAEPEVVPEPESIPEPEPDPAPEPTENPQ